MKKYCIKNHFFLTKCLFFLFGIYFFLGCNLLADKDIVSDDQVGSEQNIVVSGDKLKEDNEYKLSQETFLEEVVNRIEDNFYIFKKVAYCRVIVDFLAANKVTLPAKLRIKMKRFRGTGDNKKWKMHSILRDIRDANIVNKDFFKKVDSEFKKKGDVSDELLSILNEIIEFIEKEFSYNSNMISVLKQCFKKKDFAKLDFNTVPIASYYYGPEGEKHFGTNFPSVGWVDVWFDDIYLKGGVKGLVCVTFLYTYNYDDLSWKQVDYNYREVPIEEDK